jgi:hypothetical protein
MLPQGVAAVRQVTFHVRIAIHVLGDFFVGIASLRQYLDPPNLSPCPHCRLSSYGDVAVGGSLQCGTI